MKSFKDLVKGRLYTVRHNGARVTARFIETVEHHRSVSGLYSTRMPRVTRSHRFLKLSTGREIVLRSMVRVLGEAANNG